MKASSYKELIIWQKAMELTEEVYRLIKYLPKEETFALSDQMRRAAVSIPSNIAEGHGRLSIKEFINFIAFARGSLYEVETQLEIAYRLKYLTDERILKANELVAEISKMLNSFLSYLYTKANKPKS